MMTYKGVQIDECGDRQVEDASDVKPGIYYLILRSPTMVRGGSDTYRLRTEPGRTNQSHEPKTQGWLGTTNDIAYYAQGCVEVYRAKGGHLRIRKTNKTPAIEVSE